MRLSLIAITIYLVTAILLFFLSEFFYHASAPFLFFGMLSNYFLYPYILALVLLGGLLWAWWKKDSSFVWRHYGIIVSFALLMIVLLPVLQPEYTYSEAEDLVEKQTGIHVLADETYLLWDKDAMERAAYRVATNDPEITYLVDPETGEIGEMRP